MNATKILIIVIVLLGLAAVAFIFTRPQEELIEEDEGVIESIEDAVDDSSIIIDTDPHPESVTFNITGRDFEFSETEIEVQRGQTVTINFTSEQGLHDFVIDELDVRTAQVSAGQSTSLTFVADQVGEFEYYCSVMQHRQMGMVGTITVVE